MQSGLYIVGTPIGNLSDMSPRAIDVLKTADLIAAEDTRVAGKLLCHFGIKTKMIALHEHNERETSAKIADMIAGRVSVGGAAQLEGLNPGAAVALVSDSGMPAISDPGFRVIRTCRADGLPVFVVPGPTALVSALVLSGFPTDRFTFCGFLPSGDVARETVLRNDNKIRHTIIYYESPNRIMDTVSACARIMPERRMAIVREITKIHEETIIGYPAEISVRAEHSFKGEIVIVIEPAPDVRMSDDQINEIVREVVAGGISTKSAANEIAERTGISKSEAYERVIKK
ncbi:MAG: 16S rRNA (cytidine(1402)-2'-O)-methyltransferase [Rickettsiales bacterium]|jgi:16S rRNA (cytidine1402-2'-O)-methyltransferase|nr:16S rRNA (cytidine(1402)-2'-O)-methyltransferase [Rickettsiales bacterium]